MLRFFYTVIVSFGIASFGPVFFALSLFLTATAAAPTLHAQGLELGTIHFPTSGSRQAQPYFLQGVAALHSFWYPEAEEAFQKAQEIDPDFAMAYWGEAMCHNYALWRQEDREAAWGILNRLGETLATRLGKTGTEKERLFLKSLEILYGDGDKPARDIAYSQAMKKFHERYPDDQEVAAFYALSRLGTLRPNHEDNERINMEAAAIAQRVLRENPNHPGAAHYLIHAVDDPIHAPLGLHAAHLYAKIAPASNHALHMPSHIFIKLGMWDETILSNADAYAASDKWVERKGLSIDERDYHSYLWMVYGHLQRGEFKKAKEMIGFIEQVLDETGDDNVRYSAVKMKSYYTIETGQWDKAPFPKETDDTGSPTYVEATELLTIGFGSVWRGDLSTAHKAAGRITVLKERNESAGEDYRAKLLTIMEAQLMGLIAQSGGESDQALRWFETAAAVEDSLTQSGGPPRIAKPPHELYGEALMQADRLEAAASQFKIALKRNPNRSLAVLGLARAAARTGDSAIASEQYAQFLENYSQADSRLASLKEARKYRDEQPASLQPDSTTPRTSDRP